MRQLSLFKTIILLLLVFVLAQWGEVITCGGMVLGVCAFLSLVLLLGSAYYVVKVKKMKLFFLLLPVLLLSLTGSVSAYASSGPIEYVKLEEYADAAALGESVCNGLDSGMIDMQTLAKARSVLDYFNTHYDPKEQKGLFGSSGSTGLQCAKDYVEYAGEVQNASKATCSPTRAILQSLATRNKCWPCDVTSTIIAGIQRMAVNSYNTINGAAKLLLGGIYLMWLAITVLISFAKFGFEKFGEFFTKLISQTIIVAIIAVILHFPIVRFYNIVISPFISYAAALGYSISETTQTAIRKKNNDLFTQIIDSIGIRGSARCHYCEEMQEDLMDADVQTGQFMNTESIRSILCLTCSTYRQVAPMISLGQVMVCLGRTTPQTLGQIPILSSITQFSAPNMSLTMMGYLMVIVFSYMMLLVGYFVMASVFKLGVVLVLMPLFITAFAFKFSRPYATKAWTLILFSMATLIVISILVGMLMIGYTSLLPPKSIAGFIQLFFSNNPTMIADMMGGSNIAALISSGDTSAIMESISSTAVDTSTFLALITMTAYSYICISVLSGTTALTEQITNAWQLNTQETALLSAGFMQASGKAMKSAKMATQGAVLGATAVRDLVRKDSNGNVIAGSEQKRTIRQLYDETKELSEKVSAGGDVKAKEANKKKDEGA